jgi:hypothetical protein
LQAGDHGIGDCVSDFAKQHGASERDKHSKDEPSEKDNDSEGANGQSPRVSPSPGFEGRSDRSHSQGAQHNSAPSPGPGTEGKSDSHPVPAH